LTCNGGSSLKDVLIQTAKDSKEALEVSRRFLSEIEQLKREHVALEEKFARFIVHQQRNTLSASHLLKEEQDFLKRHHPETLKTRQDNGE
jgi:hypothetical protein